jgi:hypothetical protein
MHMGFQGVNLGEKPLCVKAFPLAPFKTTAYCLLSFVRCQRTKLSKPNMEVFGKGCGEEPFYKKVLPAISSLARFFASIA